MANIIRTGSGGGGSSKNYIFKDGVLKITPQAQGGVTVASSGITISANGYLTLPYAKSGETVFVKFKVLTTGAYNSFSTKIAVTTGYQANTSTGTIMGAYAFVGGTFVLGGATENVISLAFSQSILISEIWTEPNE